MLNNELCLLKTTLQTLALPVSGQIRLVASDGTPVEALAAAFSATHQSIHMTACTKLTPQQARALARLDDQLAGVCRESAPPLASELAMRRSSEWRHVRTMAREALVHFRWPLEVPLSALIAGDGCLTKMHHGEIRRRGEHAAMYSDSYGGARC